MIKQPNQYTDVTNALKLLSEQGSLSLGDQYITPSINEVTAYKTLLLSKDPLVCISYFVHESRLMLPTPKAGMGVTQIFPNDSYPYEIIKVVSKNTLEIRQLGYSIEAVEPHQVTYYSDDSLKTLRIRLNSKGKWTNGSLKFSVGQARYYRDHNI